MMITASHAYNLIFVRFTHKKNNISHRETRSHEHAHTANPACGQVKIGQSNAEEVGNVDENERDESL